MASPTPARMQMAPSTASSGERVLGWILQRLPQGAVLRTEIQDGVITRPQ